MGLSVTEILDAHPSRHRSRAVTKGALAPDVACEEVYSITATTSPAPTVAPAATLISLTLPAFSAWI